MRIIAILDILCEKKIRPRAIALGGITDATASHPHNVTQPEWRLVWEPTERAVEVLVGLDLLRCSRRPDRLRGGHACAIEHPAEIQLRFACGGAEMVDRGLDAMRSALVTQLSHDVPILAKEGSPCSGAVRARYVPRDFAQGLSFDHDRVQSMCRCFASELAATESAEFVGIEMGCHCYLQ